MIMTHIFSKFSVMGVCLLATVACTDNDDPEKEDLTMENIKKGILSGSIAAAVNLDKSSYQLTGSFIVKKGGSLTIPKGTKIEATAGGTDVYIAVLKGAKININGTADAPVVITSKDAKSGDWGGLVICGKAKTTAGSDVTAEVGGFKYGADDDADNSGKINYLVIKGTGAQINAESQYNGISFYAVGSGTSVSNIAVINGADDGVEFFGGAVDATNVYLKDNEDDSVDWTEGWRGTLTKTYITHTKDGFSTALEGDKENKNPHFKGLTAISTAGPSASSQIGLQFKQQSGATITDLWLEGYRKPIDMKDGGALRNVKIEGNNADPNATYQKAGAKIDVSSWSWVNR